MLSPRRTIPPAITRHNIPRRPRSSRRSPGLIFSSKSQGVHDTLTSSCASPMRRRSRTGNPFTWNPRVVMFSRMIPACSSINCRVSLSMSKTWRTPRVLNPATRESPRSPPSVGAPAGRGIDPSHLPCLSPRPPARGAHWRRYLCESAYLQSESFPQRRTPWP
jgi:hypothetical protein